MKRTEKVALGLAIAGAAILVSGVLWIAYHIPQPYGAGAAAIIMGLMLFAIAAAISMGLMLFAIGMSSAE